MQIEKEERRQAPHLKDYVSAFPTSLALARWTRGGDIPHVYSSTRHAPLRAAWYAQAQRQFQSWLEAGGFRQYDAEARAIDCLEAPPK